MNDKTKNYIKSLARDNWEIDVNDIIELIEQLELEGVIKVINIE